MQLVKLLFSPPLVYVNSIIHIFLYDECDCIVYNCSNLGNESSYVKISHDITCWCLPLIKKVESSMGSTRVSNQ